MPVLYYFQKGSCHRRELSCFSSQTFPSKTQSTFCVYASLSDNHTAFSMSSVLYQILSRLPFPKQNETTVSANIKRIQEYLDPVSYKGIAKHKHFAMPFLLFLKCVELVLKCVELDLQFWNFMLNCTYIYIFFFK